MFGFQMELESFHIMEKLIIAPVVEKKCLSLTISLLPTLCSFVSTCNHTYSLIDGTHGAYSSNRVLLPNTANICCFAKSAVWCCDDQDFCFFMYTLTHMHAYSLVVSVLTPYYSEVCVCVLYFIVVVTITSISKVKGWQMFNNQIFFFKLAWSIGVNKV